MDEEDKGGPEGLAPPVRSLSDDVRLLLTDAKRYAETEFAYQKARAAYAGKAIGGIALAVGLALVLAFFALMALTFGLVLALVPILTAWGATGAVAGGLVLFALLSALFALVRWRRMMKVLADQEPAP